MASLSTESCLLDRFKVTGMDTHMPEDYEKLLAILDDAVTQQRAHTLVMLEKPSATSSSRLMGPSR